MKTGWKNIIIHCSDSDWGCTRVIRGWHLARKWRDIGYHFVIMNGYPMKGFFLPSADGAIECGRMLDGDPYVEKEETGAHALGFNNDSIGICLIGKEKFTPRQFGALQLLIGDLRDRFLIARENVLGHCETPLAKGKKTCPNFDVENIRNLLL